MMIHMIHLDIQNNKFQRKDADLGLDSLYNLNLSQGRSNKGENSLIDEIWKWKDLPAQEWFESAYEPLGQIEKHWL